MKSEARRPAAPVRIGQDDAKVVAHPAFREIPKCLFPLGSEAAQAEYDALSRLLFDAGRLTAGAHRALSSYSMQFDTITKTASEGKAVRGSWFAQLDKARKELNLDEISTPIAAPAGTSDSKFSRTGWPNRRR